ncbi:MAG TPA: cytochrome c-type biogenesis protein CcmH [Solirubrobacterales bacterium]|nr:cytochrome c-type biogenesis protein CcmH [Solirubrobacterales bacterium]
MRRVVFASLLALLALAATAQAATPQTTLTEIEGEVMCPICGTLLELAESPQSERERALISRLIAEGRTKGEIKDELVAQYGDRVLALPQGSGFDLSAYLVPVIAFLLAVGGVGVSIWRWRRRARGPDGAGGDPATAAPSGEEAERLDADLARYDL